MYLKLELKPDATIRKLAYFMKHIKEDVPEYDDVCKGISFPNSEID